MGLEVRGKQEAWVLLRRAGRSQVPGQPCPDGVRHIGAPVPQGREGGQCRGQPEDSVLGLWAGAGGSLLGIPGRVWGTG